MLCGGLCRAGQALPPGPAPPLQPRRVTSRLLGPLCPIIEAQDGQTSRSASPVVTTRAAALPDLGLCP